MQMSLHLLLKFVAFFLPHLCGLCSHEDFGQQHPGLKYKATNRRRIAGQLLESAHEDTVASVQPIMDRAISIAEH